MLHKDAGVSDGIHVVQSWEVADAAALAAIVPAASDVGRIARQLDTGKFHILENHSPIVWQELGGSSAIIAFRARRTADIAITSGIYNKVIFPTEDRDTNNNYDPGTGRFTATVATDYHFSWLVRCKGNDVAAALYKNGVMHSGGVYGASFSGVGISGSSDTVFLAIGDYVEVWVYTGGTGTQVIGTTNETYFSGFRIK